MKIIHRIKRVAVLIAIVFISTVLMANFIFIPAEAAGEKISLDMRNADIRDVLSAIALTVNKNIIFTAEPQRVDILIEDIDPKAALGYVINIAGLTYIEDGNTLIVGYRDTLNQDFYSRMSLSKFVLKFVTSNVISSQIDVLELPVKKVMLETNPKAIWIQGLPQDLSKVNELINMLDRPENAAKTEDDIVIIDPVLQLTPIKTNHISAELADDLVRMIGIGSGGIVIDSNPNTLWVYADSNEIAQIKSIITKFDIPENAVKDSFLISTVKLTYITTDEIIPILQGMDLDISIITFNRSLKKIWITGSDEAIKLANEVVKVFDIKDHSHENVFFIYQAKNITAQELKNRMDYLQLPNVTVNYINYPEFSKSVIVYCPADYEIYVMNHIDNFDVQSEKIKMPIDFSDASGGVAYLRQRRDLLVELTGIPASSFTISNSVSRDGSPYYIMYVEESQENIKKVKDYITYIENPLLDGLGN